VKTQAGIFQELAKEQAIETAKKNEAYGDSCVFVTKVFELMYPDGIPVSCYQDALVMVRVLDKLSRIAHRKEAFGESPWNDIMGYALMAREIELRDALIEQVAKRMVGADRWEGQIYDY